MNDTTQKKTTENSTKPVLRLLDSSAKQPTADSDGTQSSSTTKSSSTTSPSITTNSSKPASPVLVSVHNGKVYRQFTNQLFSGWKMDPTILPATPEQVSLSWHRAKIKFSLWEQIVAFLRWSQEEHKDEAMVTLFFNDTLNEWAAEVFPQNGVGMTVRLLPGDPEYPILRKKYGKGWVQLGSIHHHCTMSAFASGTDKDDEGDRDGLHITLGKMDQAKVDIHIRAVFDKMVYDIKSAYQWIDMPAWYDAIPDDYLELITSDVFVLPASVSFPEEWKARIRPRQHVNGPGRTVLSHPYGHTHGSEDSTDEYLAHWQQRQAEYDAANPSKKTGDNADKVPDTSTTKATASATTFTKFDLKTIRTLYNIMSALKIDASTMYDMLGSRKEDYLGAPDVLAVREELFDMLKDSSVHYPFAATLLERLHVHGSK